MWTDDVDRVLEDDYLGDLPARPIEEIRAMRAECRAVEDKVSYLRRMVQGRLDIVAADLRRRSEGGSPSDLPGLVDRLPDILGSESRAAGPGRLPSGLVSVDDDDLTADLDTVAGPGVLDALPDLTDEAVADLGRRIGDLERQVSDRRKGLFSRIDALQAELARRYRTGEANVGTVLGDR
ncbi:MAG: hypothetical protein M3066_16910 [Actinomycetota bacterium]|nr:hypothetical protein [Actinomycetota bacterium]